MDVTITCTFQTKAGLATTIQTEQIQAKQALLIADELQQTGRVKNIQFLDTQNQTWTRKTLGKFLEGIQTEPHHVTVYFDGGFHHQTNKAGLGCVIYYEQNNKKYRQRKNALIEGIYSNNEAEYAALHFCIQALDELGVHHLPVTFSGDSLVVVNQLNDEWPCYEEDLVAWMDRIEVDLDRSGIIPTFEAVSRKQNKEADQLATQALDGVDIQSEHEIEMM